MPNNTIEKRQACKRRYYDRNIDKCKERAKKWKRENPEKVKKSKLKAKCKNHSITEEEFRLMNEIQKGECLICKKDNKNNKDYKKRMLFIDHDHKTGKVRGLLCTKCNSGIGMFEDNIKLLEEAIKYLKINKI